MHAERERHEERLLRAAGDRGVPLEHRETLSWGKHFRQVLGPGLRRIGVVLRHPRRLRVARRAVLELVPVVQVRTRDGSILDDVPAVRVAEDAVLGEVRRPGPDGDGRVVPGQDEKLVVHDLARRARRAEPHDLRAGDSRFVPLARTRAAGDTVVDDAHLGARRGGVLDGLQRGGPLELVHRAVEAEEPDEDLETDDDDVGQSGG